MKDLATHDDYVFIRIVKGVYGLRNTAVLAYDNLKQKLKKFGFYPVEGTVGVWKHQLRRIWLYVCVDDFGVKYYTRDDAEHFLKVLGSNYKYMVD